MITIINKTSHSPTPIYKIIGFILCLILHICIIVNCIMEQNQWHKFFIIFFIITIVIILIYLLHLYSLKYDYIIFVYMIVCIVLFLLFIPDELLCIDGMACDLGRFITANILSILLCTFILYCIINKEINQELKIKDNDNKNDCIT